MKYNIPALRRHYYKQLIDRKQFISYQSISNTLSNIERRLVEMSRLTDKLAQAGAVVGRQTNKIEARADALIAREADIESKTNQAFMPHETMLDEAAKGLDDLEKELAKLSNAAPLDGSSAGSVTQPPLSIGDAFKAMHPLPVDKDGRVIG